MAATAGICTSFKQELLEGTPHNLEAVTDTYYMALLTNASTITPSTITNISGINGQVSGTGYVAGGKGCATNTVATGSGKAYWTPGANISWTGATFTTEGAFLYLQATGEAVAIFTFASQSVSSGTFTLQMPTNDATNALIRLN